jgi:hypothetical protein
MVSTPLGGKHAALPFPNNFAVIFIQVIAV